MAKSSAEKIEVIFPKLSFSWILLKTKAHPLLGIARCSIGNNGDI
jgi:hypothetical protein